MGPDWLGETLFGGGAAVAAVGWMRERRLSKRDEGQLALAIAHDLRNEVRDLRNELGELRGELRAERRHSAELLTAKLRLEAELDGYRQGITKRRASDG